MRNTFHSLLDALTYFSKHPEYVAFNLKGKILEHPKTQKKYLVEKITFLDTFKFEDNSDADTVTMLHLVKVDSQLKGFFIDASGMYSDLDV